MSNRENLKEWVIEALTNLGGSGSVVQVSRAIWETHQTDLLDSGDLFYTWQYDVRWAAQNLRNAGVLVRLHGDRSGLWTLESEVAVGKSGSPWNENEIAVAVESYLRMLAQEVAGENYSKAAENRNVMVATGRGRASVEFKYANISAVLDELGMRYVRGYKPRANFQLALRAAVMKRLGRHPD